MSVIGSQFNSTGAQVAVLGPATINQVAITKSQRVLVAALALDQRGGATTNTLADIVWDSQLPASARASIQNQVSRLRNAFDTDLIQTDGDRYFLNGTIDIHTFETSLQPWLDEPSAAQSIPALSAALSMWRGSPFEDIDGHILAIVERTRLEHLRGIAIEKLAIARLLQNQFSVTIGELLVRTATTPFHERSWELLMVALYLSGRRTEALSNYAKFEQVLSAELGAEPSTVIKRLRAVMALDQPLDVSEALRVPSPAVTEPLPLRVLATA